MKLFRRNQDKDVEKPIITYYVKYIGVLSSNKSYPLEEGADVNIYEDRVVVELLKNKFKTTIPYKNMTDIQNVDAGNKVDIDRVVGLGLLSAGIGSIVGLLWKRHHIITIIKYTDETPDNQTIALDFIHNTNYAQPLIDRKMREVQNPSSHADTKATVIMLFSDSDNKDVYPYNSFESPLRESMSNMGSEIDKQWFHLINSHHLPEACESYLT